MLNHYTPYYNMPTCYSQYQSEADEDMRRVVFPDASSLEPITPITEPQAITLESTEYLNGYLRTKIGEKVKVDFLIGTGTLVDKFGTLLSVGANYITIRQAETDDIVVCDFYTIKFITFYY
ncbi:MAG TPA: hypothetical protein VIK78_12755 [Ruminiclostridium sp.]